MISLESKLKIQAYRHQTLDTLFTGYVPVSQSVASSGHCSSLCTQATPFKGHKIKTSCAIRKAAIAECCHRSQIETGIIFPAFKSDTLAANREYVLPTSTQTYVTSGSGGQEKANRTTLTSRTDPMVRGVTNILPFIHLNTKTLCCCTIFIRK
jgi:hypothetical protein